MTVDDNALAVNQYGDTTYCHRRNELCVRLLLQRDSSFVLPQEHSEPSGAATAKPERGFEMHGVPVHANAEKRVMRRSTLALLHAAPSSATAEKSSPR